MTSPLPPSARVRPVMFGEPWTDPTGTEQIADQDLVLLEFLIDGKPAAARTQTPESATALARLLVDAAGTCFRNTIDDTGKRAPATERLARFNAAWSGR